MVRAPVVAGEVTRIQKKKSSVAQNALNLAAERKAFLASTKPINSRLTICGSCHSVMTSGG